PPRWPPPGSMARRWCCCRPPAPAGISSPATTSAATGSPNWRAAWRPPPRAKPLPIRPRPPREAPDAHSVTRRQLVAWPLVVDRGPLDPGRHRAADPVRLRHDAGGQPGGGGAYRLLPRHVHRQTGVLPGGGGGTGHRRVDAVAP